MNDHDKAGRYLIKRDAAGFLRWLLRDPAADFHAWIDARRATLPDQRDLTNDLVAAVAVAGGYDALCLELKAEARAATLPQVLAYLGRFWDTPAGGDGLPVVSAGGVVVNFTGRAAAGAMALRPASAPDCRLELGVTQRDLALEDAAAAVAAVTAGSATPWLLGWVPLMQGGAEPGILAAWRGQADRWLTGDRDRADLRSVTLTFSTLAGRRLDWEYALRGWGVETSPYLDEIRAEAREEQARHMVLAQGRRKFGRSPTRKQQQALAAAGLARLEELLGRILDVSSWADLLADG